ncbi:MAG TPA: hypothetical protein DCM27_06335, partial [Rhodospirillaceae bacterium]|nr:hypothetical protein [Rhodospirillaceae bacterium]
MTSGVSFAAINIPFTINLSENVTVTGTPRITVDVGGNTRYATYTSGTGTNSLTFTLSPNIGDVDLDGVTVSSPIDLNGGTMKDSAGNDATLTFTPPNTSGIKINYPSLGMDFTNGTTGRYTLNGTVYNDLSSFLTASSGSFTRASIGTYYDSTGTLQTASNNTPRFDYDTVTHAAKGILIEESRTNLILRADDYTVSPWAEVIGGTASRSNTTTAFYNKAALVTVSAATGGIRQRVSGLSTQIYSWSFYIESANATSLVFRLENGAAAYGTICTVIFNPASGVFSSLAGYSKVSAKALGSGWLVSLVLPTAGGTFFANLEVIGTNGNIFKYALPQFEQGSFSTSYIPTTSSAVTRAADTLTIPTGGWFSAASGGLYAETYLSDISSSHIFAALTGAASY